MKMNSVNSIAELAIKAPFLNALLSSMICAIGIWIYFKQINYLGANRKAVGGTRQIADIHNSLDRIPKPKSRVISSLNSIENRRDAAYSAITALSVSVAVLFWTGSVAITVPFTFFGAFATWTQRRNRRLRLADQLLQVWPEVTDHLISGLHSGLSLSEALAGLGTRGPTLVRPYFLSFKEELLRTGDFTKATEALKIQFSSHGSDQILEAILLAKSLGGSQLLQIFRTLGEFLRQDLAVRKEIEMKHGWIKNSAHLSAAAPWLLLLLLSSQPGTARAFNQPSGMFILATGVVLTALAYVWMGKLGQLPKSPRVFELALTK